MRRKTNRCYMLKVIRTAKDLDKALINYSEKGKSVGFVPTMGALHQGHLSLAEKALEENDICICSIFVNPVQFNNIGDLDSYPRTEEEDVSMLEKCGVQLVFIPSFMEVYPDGVPKNEIDFGAIGNVMEGENRPGHFDGVGIVVRRLFELVRPNKAYFGKKDYQQLLVIQSMTAQLDLSIEIIAVDIMREETGLAMSSRNMRLSEGARLRAASVNNILRGSRELQTLLKPPVLERWVYEKFSKLEGFEIEYFQICASEDLHQIKQWDDTQHAIGFIVVHLEGVRLIDNIDYL